MEKDTIQICATIKMTTRDKISEIAKEKRWTFSKTVDILLEEIQKNTLQLKENDDNRRNYKGRR